MKLFTWKDFDSKGMSDPDLMASRANEILEEWLRKGPRVYGAKDQERETWLMGTVPTPYSTHQALLINIEPIDRREPCKHAPNYDDDVATGFTCQYCRKPLKATWSEE